MHLLLSAAGVEAQRRCGTSDRTSRWPAVRPPCSPECAAASSPASASPISTAAVHLQRQSFAQTAMNVHQPGKSDRCRRAAGAAGRGPGAQLSGGSTAWHPGRDGPGTLSGDRRTLWGTSDCSGKASVNAAGATPLVVTLVVILLWPLAATARRGAALVCSCITVRAGRKSACGILYILIMPHVEQGTALNMQIPDCAVLVSHQTAAAHALLNDAGMSADLICSGMLCSWFAKHVHRRRWPLPHSRSQPDTQQRTLNREAVVQHVLVSYCPTQLC